MDAVGVSVNHWTGSKEKQEEDSLNKPTTWNLFIFFPKKSKTYKGSIYMLKDEKHRFYISVLFTWTVLCISNSYDQREYSILTVPHVTECRRTKTKVIVTVNHSRGKPKSSRWPIRSKVSQQADNNSNWKWLSLGRFSLCFWLAIGCSASFLIQSQSPLKQNKCNPHN